MPGPVDAKARLGLAARLSFLVLAATGMVFAAAFLYNYVTSRDILLERAGESATNLARAAQAKLEDLLNNVEPAADMVARDMVSSSRPGAAPLELMREFLETVPGLYGLCAAFDTPGEKTLYVTRQFGQVAVKDLSKSGYDYFDKDWYLIPKILNRPVWSEPYFDEGGGDIVMSTYSVPVFKETGGQRKFLGVATADLSLDWLKREMSKLSIFKTGFVFCLSRTGTIVAHPNQALIMRQSIFSLAEAKLDPDLRATGLAMIHGETGFSRLSDSFLGKPAYVAYAPLPSNGWSVGVVVPEDELFADLRRLHRTVVVIGLAGFAALFALMAAISAGIARPIAVLARRTAAIAKGDLDVPLPAPRRNDEVGDLTRAFENMRSALKEYIANLTETTKAKERMESELKIAKSIQMSFLPKRFPPFPDITAFSLHAALVPAREVGGDLYDFFLIGDRHLFFSVGDVSGKGVPAALFMAVTKTLFKGVAEHELDPAVVLSKVNAELAKDNESMLFVTIFCGVLDFTTGELAYSNAGHPPPVLIRSTGEAEFIPMPEGLVLGVLDEASYAVAQMRLTPGDTLVIYTDGVSEAENEARELYGAARLRTVCRSLADNSPSEITQAVLGDVSRHAGQASQADDITVLALRYKGPAMV